MRATLLFSCLLVVLMPSHSQLWDPPKSQVFLPKLTAGFKKLSNDLGFVKTTPPAVKIEPTTPLGKVEQPPPTTTKPVEGFEQSPPTGCKINVHSYQIPVKLPEEKPKDTPVHSPASFPPGPSALPKNNVTSVSKDGTVVFPEDAHRADAAAVNKPIGQYPPKQPLPTSLDPQVCEKGKAYPPNDPCGKSFDARVVCTDGTSLDENNKCRPNDL